MSKSLSRRGDDNDPLSKSSARLKSRLLSWALTGHWAVPHELLVLIFSKDQKTIKKKSFVAAVSCACAGCLQTRVTQRSMLPAAYLCGRLPAERHTRQPAGCFKCSTENQGPCFGSASCLQLIATQEMAICSTSGYHINCGMISSALKTSCMSSCAVHGIVLLTHPEPQKRPRTLSWQLKHMAWLFSRETPFGLCEQQVGAFLETPLSLWCHRCLQLVRVLHQSIA